LLNWAKSGWELGGKNYNDKMVNFVGRNKGGWRKSKGHGTNVGENGVGRLSFSHSPFH